MTDLSVIILTKDEKLHIGWRLAENPFLGWRFNGDFGRIHETGFYICALMQG